MKYKYEKDIGFKTDILQALECWTPDPRCKWEQQWLCAFSRTSTSQRARMSPPAQCVLLPLSINNVVCVKIKSVMNNVTLTLHTYAHTCARALMRTHTHTHTQHPTMCNENQKSNNKQSGLWNVIYIIILTAHIQVKKICKHHNFHNMHTYNKYKNFHSLHSSLSNQWLSQFSQLSHQFMKHKVCHNSPNNNTSL
jgi:hypothetical protein